MTPLVLLAAQRTAWKARWKPPTGPGPAGGCATAVVSSQWWAAPLLNPARCNTLHHPEATTTTTAETCRRRETVGSDSSSSSRRGYEWETSLVRPHGTHHRSSRIWPVLDVHAPPSLTPPGQKHPPISPTSQPPIRICGGSFPAHRVGHTSEAVQNGVWVPNSTMTAAGSQGRPTGRVWVTRSSSLAGRAARRLVLFRSPARPSTHPSSPPQTPDTHTHPSFCSKPLAVLLVLQMWSACGKPAEGRLRGPDLPALPCLPCPALPALPCLPACLDDGWVWWCGGGGGVVCGWNGWIWSPAGEKNRPELLLWSCDFFELKVEDEDGDE